MESEYYAISINKHGKNVVIQFQLSIDRILLRFKKQFAIISSVRLFRCSTNFWLQFLLYNSEGWIRCLQVFQPYWVEQLPNWIVMIECRGVIMLTALHFTPVYRLVDTMELCTGSLATLILWIGKPPWRHHPKSSRVHSLKGHQKRGCKEKQKRKPVLRDKERNEERIDTGVCIIRVGKHLNGKSDSTVSDIRHT